MGVSRKNGRDADRGKYAVTIGYLLTEKTHAAAAQKAGIGEATLRRWLRRPAFVALYRAARRAVVDRAIARLQVATSSAVDAIERALTSGSPGVELRAAGLLMELALRGVELGDLAARVERLEQLEQKASGGEDRT